MTITLNGTTGVTTTGLTSNGIDDNATSTAMTLDSSGNLLVGKTDTSSNTAGTTLWADGFLNSTVAIASANTSYVARFNRKTSDGSILDFRKDGVTVGSIGVTQSGANIYYAGGATKSGVEYSNSAWRPWYDGARSDNVVDLGTAANRFKDAYFSGGVHLGGTGSANKLTDYEFGTFTPTSPTVSFSASTGSYTKIGRQVFYEIDVTLPSTSSGVQFLIDGMPFSNASKGGAFIKYTTNGTVITFNNNAGARVSAFNLDSNLTTLASVSGRRFSIVGQYFVA